MLINLYANWKNDSNLTLIYLGRNDSNIIETVFTNACKVGRIVHQLISEVKLKFKVLKEKKLHHQLKTNNVVTFIK